MVLGASPKDSSPPEAGSTSFGHNPFNNPSTSSPNPTAQAQYMSTNDVFAPPNNHQGQSFSLSPGGERKTSDRGSSSLLYLSESEGPYTGPDLASAPTTIFIRRLPRNTSPESLRSMLLFAKDLIGTEFVASEHGDDKNYVSAVARFGTLTGAHEARDRLHGKPNAANETSMIVDVIPSSLGAGGPGRRYDNSTNRQPSNPAPSTISTSGPGTRQSSRFNGTFQSMEKVSPPNHSSGIVNGEFPAPDANTAFSNLFSPQSPLANAHNERQRVSGKSVINDDTGDDETGELLKDPVAYAKTGQSGQHQMNPRATSQQMPISRFGNLSLNTDGPSTKVGSPPVPGYTSPRPSGIKSPASGISPNSMSNIGPNASYQLMAQHYQRHNYPPVNPADQNPPCNTLYVGNLPMDTSEDELKAMFSKQRGYKRLCFRTKQNGPMCFVEFEDVSFATKALNELYGHPLHNSVKGGIRLSFSKNPLGVRGGQNNQNAGLSPQGAMGAMGGGGGGSSGFAAANGPPPGLSAPPGLGGQGNMSGSNIGMGLGGMFGAPGFGGMGPAGMNNPVRTQPMTAGPSTTAAGGPYGGVGVDFSDYMMGR